MIARRAALAAFLALTLAACAPNQELSQAARADGRFLDGL